MRALVLLWKNLVFLSPASSHVSLDFCHQNISSLARISSYSVFSYFSFAYDSASMPLVIMLLLRFSSYSSNLVLISKILPTLVLFQLRTLHLIVFNLDTKQKSLDPETLVSFHHCSIQIKRLLSLTHICSNLKGHHLGWQSSDILGWTG